MAHGTLPSTVVQSVLHFKMTYGHKILPEALRYYSVEDMTVLIRDIVRNCLPQAKQVIAVPSARCPVVKLLYSTETETLQCDITVNNKYAFINSARV